MLSGEARALYEGQFGEQSQVWRMKEIVVRRKAGSPASDVSMEDNPSYAINAGFHPNTSAFDLIANQINRNTGGRRNSNGATSITNAIVNLLENHPTDEHMVAILGGLEGYDMLKDEDVKKILKKRREGDEEAEGAALPGDELELMLLGTGHSAWGEFLLRGRVRLWDGMISLVKEYTVSVKCGRGKLHTLTLTR